jgi:hypothetical protein
LWDPTERLQVPRRPSGREIIESKPLNKQQMHIYNYEPETSGETSQRNSRSLSPKSSRRRLDDSGSQMFKSRYYQAAVAAHRSVTSPERPLSTAGRKVASPYSHKPDVATESARQIYTNLSEEEKEENLRTIKNRYTNSDGLAEPARGPRNVFSLMARLNSVDRANPDAALAQIDAILRAESRSNDGDPVSVTRESSQNAQDTAGADQEAVESNGDDESSSEGDSDDETSVSSITDPTYQSGKPTPDPKEPLSTSANRRPRPSALQAYAKSSAPYMNIAQADEPNVTSARDRESKSKSKKLRSPPPTSISLSSSKEKSKKSGESDAPVVDPSVFQTINGDAPAIATSNSAEELAEKIRRWDDMSQSGPAPNSPTRSTNPFDSDSPVQQVGSNPEMPSAGPGEILSAGTEARGSSVTKEIDAKRRAHPWDSSIPVGMGNVDMKDTSMELGDGVETRYTARYGTDEKSPDGTPVRQTLKERFGLGIATLRKSGEQEEGLVAPATKSNLKETFSGDEFDVNPMLMVSEDHGDGDGWEVTARGFSPRRQEENTKNLSAEYDSAWVALPSSAFFAERAKQSTERTRPTTRPPKRDVSGIPPQITVTPDEDFPLDEISAKDEDEGYNPKASRRALPVQKFSPEMQQSARLSRYTPPKPAMHPPAAYDEGHIGDNTDDDEMGSIEVALVEPPGSLGRTESRGRRGLRGLLKRRSNSKGAAKAVVSSEAGGGSRRFNSAILLQQAVDPVTGEIVPPRGRNRFGAKPPSRERAQSLEERRTRNPTIAKKFSRLMRLYDDDDVGHI